MSMKPTGMKPIPEETSRLAKAIFPKGTLVMNLREELGPIYSDDAFAHLFAKRGRPAVEPAILAWVTVMQAMEQLTDKQAVHAVRARIDWKYALGLDLFDLGFDSSILSDFRQRLVEEGAENLVLEPILTVCRERGWIKAGGKQRTDSTMVLAWVRSLNSLESVGESMRAVLNTIAAAEPDWLDERLNPEWFDRYVHRFEQARFPKEESKRAQLRTQVGQDVQQLLHLLDEETTPASLRDLPEVGLLRQLFAQHYEINGEKVAWRDGPAVKNAERVVSPYDPEARSSRKRETTWLGYKVHLTETCDQDPDRPHVVVQVETTPATIQDSDMLEDIQEELREQDLAPAEHYVDQGYTSGLQLVKQEELGTRIMGPVPEDTRGPHRARGGYAAQDFQIDREARVAICPQGQESLKWSTRYDEHNQPFDLIRFPLKVCQQCPVHELCTKATKQGRTLNLQAQPIREALEERRIEQFTPPFLHRYAIRAGIEGTISQAVRGFELRRTPSVGIAKTHLHHLTIAAGINLIRIDAHLQAQANGRPTRPSRSRTPLARLQERRKLKSA